MGASVQRPPLGHRSVGIGFAMLAILTFIKLCIMKYLCEIRDGEKRQPFPRSRKRHQTRLAGVLHRRRGS